MVMSLILQIQRLMARFVLIIGDAYIYMFIFLLHYVTSMKGACFNVDHCTNFLSICCNINGDGCGDRGLLIIVAYTKTI